MCECNFNSDVNNMSQSERDVFYMKRALELAEYALSLGEVPVGAVAVWEDDEKRGIVSEIVGEGYNRRESGKNALYHAEMDAINSACERLGGWRLHKCTLYVTLEPCAMCAGAIVRLVRHRRHLRHQLGHRLPHEGDRAGRLAV